MLCETGEVGLPACLNSVVVRSRAASVKPRHVQYQAKRVQARLLACCVIAALPKVRVERFRRVLTHWFACKVQEIAQLPTHQEMHFVPATDVTVQL